MSWFYYDLTIALLSANIPLNRLENPKSRNFLEKYTNRLNPNRSSVRKNYVSKCYNVKVNVILYRGKVIHYVASKTIWVSLDETTYSEGRFIVGTLKIGFLGKTFFYTTKFLEKAKNSTNAKMFNNYPSLLWPEGVEYDNVILFMWCLSW